MRGRLRLAAHRSKLVQFHLLAAAGQVDGREASGKAAAADPEGRRVALLPPADEPTLQGARYVGRSLLVRLGVRKRRPRLAHRATAGCWLAAAGWVLLAGWESPAGGHRRVIVRLLLRTCRLALKLWRCAVHYCDTVH